MGGEMKEKRDPVRYHEALRRRMQSSPARQNDRKSSLSIAHCRRGRGTATTNARKKLICTNSFLFTVKKLFPRAMGRAVGAWYIGQIDDTVLQF